MSDSPTQQEPVGQQTPKANRPAAERTYHPARRSAPAESPAVQGPDYDFDGVPDQHWDNDPAAVGAAFSGRVQAPRRTALMSDGARLQVGELERLEEIRSQRHPGDRHMRRVQPTTEGFKRLGPRHLEALPGTLDAKSGTGRFLTRVKTVAIGTPISTAEAAHERLTIPKALAVLSSDALSSVAYATQAVLGALLVAGPAALGFNLSISIAIAILIGIVVFSYRQTIAAYPKGGGSYIVAKSNLGQLPGLVAGASLLIDYVLTVAVSISAGVSALISLYPALRDEREIMVLIGIVLITVLNLRGVRESGTIFAIPTYVFLLSIFFLIGLGFFQFFTGSLGTVTEVQNLVAPGTQTIGLLLILHAFASGCTALTGIEAISDGVPVFKAPEATNASRTLVILGVLLSIMFMGISFLAEQVQVQLSDTETVISQIGRTVFGGVSFLSWMHPLVQYATALILLLAANTAYSDFPRLGFFLARDKFLPHQFAFRGDRLAYSRGIITLGIAATVLVLIFGGEEAGMLPLYAIGVFSSFTLSQTGMVVRWWRLRTPGWRQGLFVNALGAITTLVVLVVLAAVKFVDGAWVVLVIVPLMVLLLLRIHAHYTRVAEQLNMHIRTSQVETISTTPGQKVKHLIVLPVASINEVALRTLDYARSITDNVVAVHVASDEEEDKVRELEQEWQQHAADVPLVIVESPYRSLNRPLLAYIDALHSQQPQRILTVMLPEFVARRWWEHLLHNQTALRLKGALLFRPDIVVTSVPYHLEG